MASTPVPPPKNPNRYSSVDLTTNPSDLSSSSQQAQQSQDGNNVEEGKTVPVIVVTKQPVDGDALEKQNSIGSDSSDDMAKVHLARPGIKSATSCASVWPTRQELQQKALMTKKERMRQNCSLFGRMTQRQRMWARILLAALAICAAVGIGVGISLAVGGGVYKSEGQQSTIPKPNGR